MAVKKIAISVPEDVLKRVDKLAKMAKTTRSTFISRVLGEISKASSKNDVVKKINALFEDATIVEDQLSTSNYFLRSPTRKYGDDEW